MIPHWSDVLRRRKLPIIVGTAIQLAVILILLYVADIGSFAAIVLCFVFGFANATHMLAFSTAADVVRPDQIGTSAAIVNGIMFIVGGILIAVQACASASAWMPGLNRVRSISRNLPAAIIVALVIALVVACLMRETFPKRDQTGNG